MFFLILFFCMWYCTNLQASIEKEMIVSPSFSSLFNSTTIEMLELENAAIASPTIGALVQREPDDTESSAYWRLQDELGVIIYNQDVDALATWINTSKPLNLEICKRTMTTEDTMYGMTYEPAVILALFQVKRAHSFFTSARKLFTLMLNNLSLQDKNVLDSNGKNLLLHATEKNYDTSLIKELLTAGIDIQAEDFDGYTALNYAIKSNNPHVVKLLLEQKNINVNYKMDDGDMPLHQAINAVTLKTSNAQNSIEIIGLLIAHNTNINQQDAHQNTPLHLAVRLYNQTQDHEIKRPLANIIGLLLGNRANKKFKNNNKQTPEDLDVENILTHMKKKSKLKSKVNRECFCCIM